MYVCGTYRAIFHASAAVAGGYMYMHVSTVCRLCVLQERRRRWTSGSPADVTAGTPGELSGDSSRCPLPAAPGPRLQFPRAAPRRLRRLVPHDRVSISSYIMHFHVGTAPRAESRRPTAPRASGAPYTAISAAQGRGYAHDMLRIN